MLYFHFEAISQWVKRCTGLQKFRFCLIITSSSSSSHRVESRSLSFSPYGCHLNILSCWNHAWIKSWTTAAASLAKTSILRITNFGYILRIRVESKSFYSRNSVEVSSTRIWWWGEYKSSFLSSKIHKMSSLFLFVLSAWHLNEEGACTFHFDILEWMPYTKYSPADFVSMNILTKNSYIHIVLLVQIWMT